MTLIVVFMLIALFTDSYTHHIRKFLLHPKNHIFIRFFKTKTKKFPSLAFPLAIEWQPRQQLSNWNVAFPVIRCYTKQENTFTKFALKVWWQPKHRLIIQLLIIQRDITFVTSVESVSGSCFVVSDLNACFYGFVCIGIRLGVIALMFSNETGVGCITIAYEK